jgi:hypothetical protein
MDYSDSIEIAVSPDVAFAAIADLPSMGRRSPENTGGEWLNGATGPALGAKFSGTNAQGSDTWSTVARVTTFDPPHTFVFEVTYGMWRIARWGFSIERTPSGCRVTEKWKDRRNYFMRRSAKKDGFDRAEFTKSSIRTTLERLKSELEQAGSSPG